MFRDLLKAFVVRHFLSFDGAGLHRALARLGIVRGQTVMLHASWKPLNGFRGRPAEFIDALRQYLGPDGLLVMPSLPYHNESSRDFLKRSGRMDVRRTPSRMGLLSETFRRHRETVRSLSPTHPLCAAGRRAIELIAGHEHALEPFGAGSPFARLRDWNARILTFDAPFSTITYTHFLEDRIAPSLPFSLYEAEPIPGQVVDADGQLLEVPVRVLSEQANSRRREHRLVARLEAEGLLSHQRLGNSRLMAVDARAMADCVDRMVGRGASFFD